MWSHPLKTCVCVMVLGTGCDQMAEHVEPKPSAPVLTLEDLAGDWRTECTLDRLLGEAEGVDVYVKMHLVIPADGSAASGAIVGTTRFEDEDCERSEIYQAGSVSYALSAAGLDDDVYVLHSTLVDHGPPELTSRFIALVAEPGVGVMMLDIDGQTDRGPLTEEPEDPQAAWGWFAQDPQARGVMAVRQDDEQGAP